MAARCPQAVSSDASGAIRPNASDMAYTDLSNSERRVLQYLLLFIERYGAVPTSRDIALGLGLPSSAHAFGLLLDMFRRGIISLSCHGPTRSWRDAPGSVGAGRWRYRH